MLIQTDFVRRNSSMACSTVFASDTGVLHAAERGHVADRPIRVDPHRARRNAFGHTECPRDVRCPDAGAEAVPDSLAMRRRRLHRGTGCPTGPGRRLPPERFASVAHIGQDRRSTNRPLSHSGAARRGRPSAKVCPLAPGDVDVVEHLVLLGAGGDRADIRRLQQGRPSGRTGEIDDATRKSSWMVSWTSSRDPAMQVWPVAAKIPTPHR